MQLDQGVSRLANSPFLQATLPSPLAYHYGRGASLKFSQVFSKKELSMEDSNKLQRELHSATLSLLRQGFTLQAVVHALIVESERLSECAAVVEAIKDFNQQP